MEWHFDKDTVRVLRYIYKHKGVTEAEILDKFDKDHQEGVSLLLINLSMDLYLVAVDESGKPFVYEKDNIPWHSKGETKWYTTAKSNLVVQSDSANMWKWLVPLFISGISLLLSGVNFVLNWLR